MAQSQLWASSAVLLALWFKAALEMAARHARERVQFGKPIGSYQAIKHPLANAWMGVDNARPGRG